MSLNKTKTADAVFDLGECVRQVNHTLDSRLPPADAPPRPLYAAMRYSVLAGGKRLRPLLCLAAARGAGATIQRALIPAAALEILHTYTLIHDDLPAMDNDTLRRGRPTLHVAFGEANAILAGDALLTMAFEWLADSGLASKTAVRLSLELSRAAGSRGVIAGQTADLAAEHQPPQAATVAYIHHHKTGCLITAAVRMGAIAGGADRETLSAITSYGEKIGLAFQIADDLLDVTATSRELGKTAGSDERQGKMTWVTVHGLAKARRTLHRLASEATAILRQLPGDTAPLATLTQMMTRRKK